VQLSSISFSFLFPISALSSPLHFLVYFGTPFHVLSFFSHTVFVSLSVLYSLLRFLLSFRASPFLLAFSSVPCLSFSAPSHVSLMSFSFHALSYLLFLRPCCLSPLVPLARPHVALRAVFGHGLGSL
jgi:hypothetical protein